jgi:hypothetical protein
MPGRNAIALAEISQQASQRCIRATLLYDNLSCPHAEEHPRGEHKSFLSAVEDLRNIWRGRADYSGLMLAARTHAKTPITVNSSVGRTREYLTGPEIEKLMAAARKYGRYRLDGPRSSRTWITHHHSGR